MTIQGETQGPKGMWDVAEQAWHGNKNKTRKQYPITLWHTVAEPLIYPMLH